MEFRHGKDLIPRDPKSIEQLAAVSWAQELIREVLSKDNMDPMNYYMVRTLYADRVASLWESNPIDVRDCQLFDMLMIREDKSSTISYQWLDTADDSTVEFLEKLAVQYANPEIYRKSQEKFAGMRRHIWEMYKRRPR